MCWMDGIQHMASSAVLRDPGMNWNWKKGSLRMRKSRPTWKNNKEKRGQEAVQQQEAERQEGTWCSLGYLPFVT